MNKVPSSRRQFFKSSVFGLIAVPTIAYFPNKVPFSPSAINTKDPLYYRYPALDDQRVSEVVGAAHGRFDTVRELVSKRPELANAAWDWGFGDWESAIGAAAHMGRRDIAEFLLDYGARPDIFTFAMLGALDVVKNMIETIPGIQQKPGPHGITLLQHTQNRLRHKDLSEEDKNNVFELQQYLESLGDANLKAKSLEISPDDQNIYIGEYRFGDKEEEVLTVDLNRRKLLQIARKGTFGRVMNKIGEHRFSPGGAPSVEISFKIQENRAVSLTVHEPDPLVNAVRV